MDKERSFSDEKLAQMEEFAFMEPPEKDFEVCVNYTWDEMKDLLWRLKCAEKLISVSPKAEDWVESYWNAYKNWLKSKGGKK